MTVIAAYYDKRGCWIGGDSGAFDEDSVVLTSDPKVWQAGDSLIGVAGTFRIIEVAKASGLSDPYELRDYLMTEYNSRAHPTSQEAEILIVNQSGIYYIGEDFSVVRSKEAYGASGAGGLIALGCLASLSKFQIEPKEVVRTALEVAAKHTVHSRAPFRVLSI